MATTTHQRASLLRSRSDAPTWIDSDASAARADYVAFLFRAPFATDAFMRGFATGVREDYALRDHVYDIVDVPVWMLDNDFRDADLDRYLGVLEAATPTPRVGVIGDAYSHAEAAEYVSVARDLRGRLDEFEPIIVPKCRAALDALPADCIAGYPLGYSDTDPDDVAPTPAWRETADGHSRPIHILGGTPPTAWAAIQRLTDARDPTQSDLSDFGVESTFDAVPADLVGLDYNGLVRVAYCGDRWTETAPHWRSADHLSIRETVQRGLSAIRRYWEARDVWPASTPKERLGAPVEEADPFDAMHHCAGCGRHVGQLEDYYRCREYDDGVVRAFCSKLCLNRVEYYDGLMA